MSGPDRHAEAAVTPYDEVRYATHSSPRIDPDRLAVIARLHGLDAPAVETARVLEVGGGDGLHLTAFAAAFPHSDCLSFDLASTAVARGKALAEAAGLTNIRIERINVLDAVESIDGVYDYIIVHGVYAWVPPPVQAAIFRLIGRVLSPNGVAIVSYNALPGQVLSQTLRTMIGEMVESTAPEERIDRVIELLKAYGEDHADDDNAFVTALRDRAKGLSVRPKFLLAHDEFGAWFEPQTFTAVWEAAADVGLAYLNDSVHLSWEQGLAGAESDEAALCRAIQRRDYQTGCLFRHSLFVRQNRPISREFDAARVAGLAMALNAEPAEPGKFLVNTGSTFTVDDPRSRVFLYEAKRRYPEQFALAGLSDDRLEMIVRLFFREAIWLSTVPTPAVTGSTHPRIGSLVRAQIERGDELIAGLNRATKLLSDDFRKLLLLLDGTRDAAALAVEVRVGVAETQAFIGLAAQIALLTA